MHTNIRVKSFPGIRSGSRDPAGWTRAAWVLTAPQRALETLRVWHDRWVERRELLQIEERILRDCGIHRADLERIARKPFWRA